jgi:hypothetical protein
VIEIRKNDLYMSKTNLGTTVFLTTAFRRLRSNSQPVPESRFSPLPPHSGRKESVDLRQLVGFVVSVTDAKIAFILEYGGASAILTRVISGPVNKCLSSVQNSRVS